MPMHPVEAYIRQRVSPPQAEIDQLIGKLKSRILRPGDLFCHMGQTYHELGLLARGTMRVFTLSEDGKDATIDFIFPVALVAALDAATVNEPSRVGIEALSECELFVCPFSIRDQLSSQGDREWTKLIQLELDEVFRRKNRYALTMQLKDATTRYRDAIQYFPPEFELIPHYHVASYLGIAPQSLSRIRSKLAGKRE